MKHELHHRWIAVLAVKISLNRGVTGVKHLLEFTVPERPISLGLLVLSPSLLLLHKRNKIVDFSGLGGIAMIVQWVPTRKTIHNEVGDFFLYGEKRIHHPLLRVVIGQGIFLPKCRLCHVSIHNLGQDG